MRISRALIIFSLLTLPISLFSNSSPVNVSFLRKTGNVILLKKANINLITENLNISVIDDYTIVEVEYVYKNLGEKDEIWYGFPIDFFSSEKARPFTGERNREITQTYIDDSKKLIKIDYFYLYDNDNQRNVIFWDTDSLYSIKTHFDFCPVYRRWYVGKIIFEKNENKTIRVKYKIKNNLQDEAFEMSYFFSKREFTYHLTPSSNWGNGIVENFNVNIDFTYCNQYQIGKSIEGLSFQTNDSIKYSFNQKNYDLNKSDRINIQYDNSFIKNAELLNDNINWQHIKISKIVTSSNNSSSKFLYDNNPNTCWIGKNGDWIDIYFYAKKSFTWLNILNGDYSSLEKFREYSKIKRYMLQKNGSEIITYIDKNYAKIEMPEYRNVNDSLKIGFAQQFLFWDCGNKTKQDIWHFRIYIQDIYKGEKSDNGAVSEIFFM
jgi:hypothetical protein